MNRYWQNRKNANPWQNIDATIIRMVSRRIGILDLIGNMLGAMMAMGMLMVAIGETLAETQLQPPRRAVDVTPLVAMGSRQGVVEDVMATCEDLCAGAKNDAEMYGRCLTRCLSQFEELNR